MLPLTAPGQASTSSATERVVCRVKECGGILLIRRYDGQWVSRHHGRAIKFSTNGQLTIEVDCAHGHSTSLLVDGERVSVID